ncbi:MAG: tRNA (guanosine(18)-2'-O)-methyltransferase TrmH [Gammaproteobacteria bacterium]|nr:tRNA (guanosine(18)-2'-O)-methyltransferase TrmH [Gammaproteobacteria bacterium]
MSPERFEQLKAVLARRQPDLTVLAEDVHKSHNISAIVRTCDAVGVMELHAVSPGGAFARHRMISGGSRKWVRTRAHRDIDTAVAAMRQQGFAIVAAHPGPGALDYREWDYVRPTALLLGSELMGVSARSAALADRHVAVPMRGQVESLNVSVAAALLLYEAARQREAAGLYARCRLDPATYAEVLFEWCYPTVARHCRQHAIPYPPLDESGFMGRTGQARSLAESLRSADRAGKAHRISDAAS